MNNLIKILIALVIINIGVTVWVGTQDLRIQIGEEECQVLGTNFVRSFLKDVKWIEFDSFFIAIKPRSAGS